MSEWFGVRLLLSSWCLWVVNRSDGDNPASTSDEEADVGVIDLKAMTTAPEVGAGFDT